MKDEGRYYVDLADIAVQCQDIVIKKIATNITGFCPGSQPDTSSPALSGLSYSSYKVRPSTAWGHVLQIHSPANVESTPSCWFEKTWKFGSS